MKFIKASDLRIGMRLAKPIYNNKGVLLYDRNSKLTQQGIESVSNFKLIGLYVLEPAEPLPPMNEEDMEFEKFQMVSTFAVKDELQSILTKGKTQKITQLAEDIVRRYGRLDHKINFIQNLRSPDDFVYKHSLNVAILTAMIMNKLNARTGDKVDAVLAALTHDVGKLKLDQNMVFGEELDDIQKAQIRGAERDGLRMLEDTFVASPNIKRAATQANKKIVAYEEGNEPDGNKMIEAARALVIAEVYDSMTAMTADGEPQSEVAVLRALRNNPKYFDQQAAGALYDSINFLAEGSCVELSNGEKALVIAPNKDDMLRPTVLCFSTNTIVDLAQTMLYSELEIVDIMKTLDNRHVMGDEARQMFEKSN